MRTTWRLTLALMTTLVLLDCAGLARSQTVPPSPTPQAAPAVAASSQEATPRAITPVDSPSVPARRAAPAPRGTPQAQGSSQTTGGAGGIAGNQSGGASGSGAAGGPAMFGPGYGLNTPGTTPSLSPGAFTAGGAPASGLGGTPGAAAGYFAMIGDMSPPVAMFAAGGNRPPPLPPAYQRSSFAPSVRGFKIAENQSPLPQDRVFFSVSAFQDVNKRLNRDFEAPFKDVQIYRYVWGFEKTFNDGLGSIGLRVPLNNITSRPTTPGLNTAGTSTALGDLTIYLKHIFYLNRVTGSLASGGFAISPQTAASQFAGAKYLRANNTTTLQPYFGYLINFGKIYVQGFNALDVPYDFNQPTMLYNDIGLGYVMYRDTEGQGFITAVAPTVEAHANIPLNHRDPFNRLDNFGTPDIVNITSGLNISFRQRSTLTFGLATPVTGPRPFSIEPQLLLNMYFGGPRRAQAARALPMIGG